MTATSGPIGSRLDPSVQRYRLRAVEELAAAEQTRLAARVVAGRSSDRDDCIELLAMLGLDVRAKR
ncbi:MAG TPA: hypothetical protein VGH99_22595 [Pseudonocardia sp.]